MGNFDVQVTDIYRRNEKLAARMERMRVFIFWSIVGPAAFVAGMLIAAYLDT